MENFFNVLGTLTAWGMWLMLCIIAFIFIKAIILGLWAIAKTMLL